MKSFINKRQDDLLFWLFAYWLLVDMLNGYLLKSGFTLSISQVYKSLVAIIVIIRCIDNKPIQVLSLCFIIYLSDYLTHIYIIGEEFGSSLTLISKLLTSLLFFTYFIQINNSDRDYFLQKAKIVITLNFAIFAVNLGLGFIGYGFTSYGGEEGFGSRGFFYSMNELSGVLAVLFPWILYYCKTKFSTFWFYLFSASFFLLSFILSSKSGIVATIMFFILINYFYGNKRDKALMVILFVALIVICFTYFQLILATDLPVMERLNYFVNKNGLIDAITSNRLHFWEYHSRELYRTDSIVWIFGLGGQRTVEMDPFDALLNCGLIGLAFLIFLYWELLSSPLTKGYRKRPYSKVVFSSNLLLVFISIGGGHILFSSMAGMLIALSNAVLFGKSSILNSRKLLHFALLKKT